MDEALFIRWHAGHGHEGYPFLFQSAVTEEHRGRVTGTSCDRSCSVASLQMAAVVAVAVDALQLIVAIHFRFRHRLHLRCSVG